MRRAIEHIAAGQWAPSDQVSQATLDFDHRNRRRLKLIDDGGEAFLLDLPQTVVLREGDGLSLAEGGIIRIAEAPEPVAEATGETSEALARLAWHLGNRHLPVQILTGGTVRFRKDPVIEAMVEGLGYAVSRLEAPFTPESGAYTGHTPGHAHHDH